MEQLYGDGQKGNTENVIGMVTCASATSTEACDPRQLRP